MKQGISSVDLAALVRELSDSLLGARIGKIYQHSSDELRLRLRSVEGGMRDLVIVAGERMHLTRHPREAERVAGAFPMSLRKHLSGGRITEVLQHDFDRIVKLGIERGGERKVLLCEFFARGNVILMDADERIILPLRSISYRDRVVRGGEVYELPKRQINPLDLGVDELARVFAASSGDVVRTIATRLNMGGLLSEEVCLRAGIEKETASDMVSAADCESIHRAIVEMLSPLLSGKLKPHIVVQDGVFLDALPFELSLYEDFEKKYFSTFNEALDEYYWRMAGETKEERVRSSQEGDQEGAGKGDRSGLYKRRLLQQEDAIRRFKAKEERLSRIGDVIYQEYGLFEEILSAVRDAREKGYSWVEIKRILEDASLGSGKAIESVDPETGSIVVVIDGLRVSVDSRLSVEQNASAYYARAKKFSSKIKGALVALERTSKMIERAERGKRGEVDGSGVKKRSVKPLRRKERWYERFKWFVSSDGFLVVGGRDSDTNELIVKKYMEKRDMFFHTQYPGSPAVIIKTEGKEVPLTTLKEVAEFTVSHSIVWKSGQAVGECYWVLPQQVSKTPEHGEFLPKGSFVIRGKRNYMKSGVGIAVGVKDGMCIGGPPGVIEKRADCFVEVEPGEFNQNDVAKKIYRIFLDWAGDSVAIKAGCAPHLIARFLPPGGSRIKRHKP
ncbi:hypothetical protein FHEFKHOI_00139 [Candidatus Methanoperedenaceae archaeon GB50]|nr:hypothetical protein FHEFKHOI_00139 [Candidatus Methanoperedenaceae archaeon GB50]CAD7779575.1 MAG: hypothetical protein KBONHNOK_01334 [Candidatus Methanoperedenaceae archaeon GB50]